jgi:hypothetical protein
MAWPPEDWQYEHYPLVEVLWVDTTGSNGWTTIKAELQATSRLPSMRCVSVGHVLEDTPEMLTVALSVNCDGQCNSSITIPRFAIVQVTPLQHAPRRNR